MATVLEVDTAVKEFALSMKDGAEKSNETQGDPPVIQSQSNKKPNR